MISKKEYKEAKKIIKAYKKQLIIPVVISCCEKYKNIVDGHHPDERTYCRVCGNDL